MGNITKCYEDGSFDICFDAGNGSIQRIPFSSIYRRIENFAQTGSTPSSYNIHDFHSRSSHNNGEASEVFDKQYHSDSTSSLQEILLSPV